MSLSFVIGGSGCGKSSFLYDTIIRESMQHPERNYVIVVPDQFTMQTQRELILRHPRHGIMNIEVLSFGRLSYRVLSETGGDSLPVIDDTGKNLILKMVASQHSEEMKVLGRSLKKQGYIHEVKSALSEFMQYGISPEQLTQIIDSARERSGLCGKLQDLQVLYRAFEEYIDAHYITREESLALLARKIPESKLLRDCYLAFDEFTGFTPIQLEVIGQLMLLAKQVWFSLLIDAREDLSADCGQQNLFHLSRKTKKALEKKAQELGVARGKDIILQGGASTVLRAAPAPALHHLEQNLFRYPAAVSRESADGLQIRLMDNPREESKFAAREIHRLVREEGYQYRDIAVVCGSLESYAPLLETEFARLGMSCFIDQNKGILLNPLVEFIRSALLLLEKDFSIDAVCHFLRCGSLSATRDEIDTLDLFIRDMRIRGKSKWSKPFRSAKGSPEERVETLRAMNDLRERIMETLSPVLSMGESAGERVDALEKFLEASGVEARLAQYEAHFEEQGDRARAKEYHQIYPYIQGLLQQIRELLGEEKLELKEFRELLDAGFGEMHVGIVPQSVDYVVIGDIERTRLKRVRVLFFLGINDGSIPKAASSGGLISDLDREYLEGLDWELAPSPRQKMFQQRMYLYMNMTKPSDALYLSFSRTSSDGSGLRPAYLIKTVQKLYENLTICEYSAEEDVDGIESWEDGIDFIAQTARESVLARFAGETISPKKTDLLRLYLQEQQTQEETTQLLQAACAHYEKQILPPALALALFGHVLVGSVTRLEKYANCSYAHFLKYGMSLQESSSGDLESVDIGTIIHEILKEFSDRLPAKGYTWFDFPLQEGLQWADALLDAVVARYEEGTLFDTARTTYAQERIRRIVHRTIETLQFQVRQGDFAPAYFEKGFRSEADLGENRKLALYGMIDRVDLFEEAEKLYVKILDYKSGVNKISLHRIYHGVQLQLFTYLRETMEQLKKEHPDKEIEPAGLLYYHLDDPMVEWKPGMDDDDLKLAIEKGLKMSGLVNGDEQVLQHLEHMEEDYLTLPISRRSHGAEMSREEMETISSYVNWKMSRMGREILEGELAVHPYEDKDGSACDYCSYKGVCGFDRKIPGYQRKVIQAEKRETVLEKMTEVLDHGI